MAHVDQVGGVGKMEKLTPRLEMDANFLNIVVKDLIHVIR